MISYKYTQSFSPIEDCYVNIKEKSIHYPNGFDFGPVINKRFIGPTIKCSDDDWEFFLKYGKVDLIGWHEQTPKEKEDFKKFLQLYQSFWELYYEYYEDLCLYAIMYRNIKKLKPTTTDVMSVRFFVSKANEVKGFKVYLTKHINKGNIYKVLVALSYFQHKNIFSKVFEKYLDDETVKPHGISHIYEMRESPSKNIVEDLNNDIIPSGVGINNLTNQDCIKISKYRKELFVEYRNAYKSSLEKEIVEEKGASYSEIFFSTKFIPYYGRISKITSSYDKVCKAELTPVLDNDSRDITLSNHERFIVQVWCRQMRLKYEAIRKEEEERQEIQRQIELEKERIRAEQKRKEEEARREKFRFNQRNRHYRDSYVSFDESTHLYKVDGVTLQSVTNFVEGCFPKFDAEFFAKKKAAYMGITTQEVLDMWEQKGRESRKLGTELHKKIENYYQDIASTEDDSFKLFLMFANKIELKPYRTEWAVYDVKHNIAGTIDFVDYQNGEYIIYDWKRSDKIIDNGMPIKISKYDEKGNHPLEHLNNTPYYHYALQLSIYKFILENNYNIKISDLRLGIFHPTYNKPYVLRIPYLEKEINDLFNLRSEVLF